MTKKILVLTTCFVLIGNHLSFSAEPTQKSEEAKAAGEKKGFGISIAPSVFRLTGKPGQSQNATVRVSNNSASPSQVLTEISDVANRVDEQGKLVRQFPPAGTTPFSCAQWTLLRDNDFTLEPGKSRDVTFITSPPADSAGGFICVVFFRGIPQAAPPQPGETAQAQATIQIQPRLGAMVFYEIEGTVKRTSELLDLTSEPPVGNAPLKIRYKFKNTGNTDVLVSGTFYILDANKVLMGKGDLKPIRMFPGDQGNTETEWPSTLSPGKYQLVISFELGPDAREVIVKELELSIP